MITKEQLLAIMPNARAAFDGTGISRAEKFLPYINATLQEFGINTKNRICHYLAQIAHESGELRYTTELGSKSYFDKYDTGSLAKNLGNTPVKDGDGYKYRGRGLIQLTGLSNYKAYREYCGFDVVKTPELLAQPKGATRSSGWYWKTHGLNELADKDDLRGITRRINGGYNGLKEREKYLNRAKRVIL